MATKTQLVNMMGEVLPERKILSDLLWFIYLYQCFSNGAQQGVQERVEN